jgi:hypothetical protein
MTPFDLLRLLLLLIVIVLVAAPEVCRKLRERPYRPEGLRHRDRGEGTEG